MSIGRVFNKCLQETTRGPTLKFAHMVDIDVVNNKKIIIKFLKNVKSLNLRNLKAASIYVYFLRFTLN